VVRDDVEVVEEAGERSVKIALEQCWFLNGAILPRLS